jgi:hypothetical protein
MKPADQEIIVVRSLMDSDLGLFAAHRSETASKQRALNINTEIARMLLSEALFGKDGAELQCVVRYGTTVVREPRHLVKSGKNWRLGGRKIEGAVFGTLETNDFALIRTRTRNAGNVPLSVTFVSKRTNSEAHAAVSELVGVLLSQSMAAFVEGSINFPELSKYALPAEGSGNRDRVIPKKPAPTVGAVVVPPMPSEPVPPSGRKQTIHEKIRSPHIMERMFQVAGDLSAPAQLRFIGIVEDLATQLRRLLLRTGAIVTIEHNHQRFWPSVAGTTIGFIDGGLATLPSLGSAPIAARVGGYIVTPGETGEGRECFTMLKHLVDELYSDDAGGAYDDSFPDASALRDAARISIEAAGGVQMLQQHPSVGWVLMHGALVNPVSRYTDIMQDGRVRHEFPNFSDSALAELLPNEPPREGRDRNFISVYLRELELLRDSEAVVCGVVEREATTSSVVRAVLDSLDDMAIQPFLPVSAAEWKQWFRHQVDPSDDPNAEGQRITDSLLFRCVLEPGEALRPVPIDRNEERRAPPAWRSTIMRYPKPYVSYVQVSEWSPPIRLEMFQNGLHRFNDAAALVSHCALLLPRYSFPVGLDIVDKFAKVPNWMARPITTHTTVQALKRALESGDRQAYDSLRRLLCGSSREWLLRPNILH